MGYVMVKGKVSNIWETSKVVEVEFIVDTGAMLTVVPNKILGRLAIKPRGEAKFKRQTVKLALSQ